MENRKATLVDFYMMCKDYYDYVDESCDDCPLHENGCFFDVMPDNIDVSKVNDQVIKWKDKYIKKQKEKNSLMSDYNSNISIKLKSKEKDKATLFDFARMCKCYYDKEDSSCDGCPLDKCECFNYYEAAETNINKINKRVLKWVNESDLAPSTYEVAPDAVACSTCDNTQNNKQNTSYINKGDNKMSFIEIKDKENRCFINTSAIDCIKDYENSIEIYFRSGKHATFSKSTISVSGCSSNIYDKICNDVQKLNNDRNASINSIFDEIFGV